ncbi:hypothetical protein Pcar_1760 [Syntrophotalea carbinolica DSM 2380]|uniref:Uncharacterized protein n=1 Tax=Syntrophotalea carbinolica (strain DSM 2380 / NBRC 103641 / GraBd1) TaxID=338963 RepID=Q3A3Q4_SYNC1|nr:hypothetical protein Pcar_1760 [Syntrophotalea carbinolica DSM 2380]
MMISVRYKDGTYDRIKNIYLDYLIATNKVDVFWRSSGPVVVGRDPVRGQQNTSFYRGVERRGH